MSIQPMQFLGKNEFPDGAAVRVYDTGRKRWYQGKVLYMIRLDEHGNADGWAVELRNGNRGDWDREHIRLTVRQH